MSGNACSSKDLILTGGNESSVNKDLEDEFLAEDSET